MITLQVGYIPNVGLTLAHRLRRWPNISPTLGQRLVFAGCLLVASVSDNHAYNRVVSNRGVKSGLFVFLPLPIREVYSPHKMDYDLCGRQQFGTERHLFDKLDQITN